MGNNNLTNETATEEITENIKKLIVLCLILIID